MASHFQQALASVTRRDRRVPAATYTRALHRVLRKTPYARSEGVHSRGRAGGRVKSTRSVPGCIGQAWPSLAVCRESDSELARSAYGMRSASQNVRVLLTRSEPNSARLRAFDSVPRDNRHLPAQARLQHSRTGSLSHHTPRKFTHVVRSVQTSIYLEDSAARCLCAACQPGVVGGGERAVRCAGQCATQGHPQARASAHN